MPDVAELTIKVNSNQVVKADKNLKGFNKTSKKTEDGVLRVERGFKSFNLVAIGAAGAAAALWSTFNNVRTIQRLKVQLETATGSVEGMEEAFANIKGLATQLPVSIEELADAFIILKNLGLDPSERALISFTNTASAMGKSLNQFIEAVADATTREFERLKEFGIRASQEGDRVRFTFRGITTEIGNNSREIQEFLTRIGEVEFAGSSIRQMSILEGQLTNLGVAWFNFTTAIEDGSGVVGRSLSATISAATNVLNEFATSEELAGAKAKFLGDNMKEAINDATIADLKEINALLADLSATSRNRRITGIGDGRFGADVEARALLKAKQEQLITQQAITISEEEAEATRQKSAQGTQAIIDLEEELNRTTEERLRLKQDEIAALVTDIHEGEVANIEQAISLLEKEIKARVKLEETIVKTTNAEIREAERLARIEEIIQEERIRKRQGFFDDLFTLAGDSNSKLFKLTKGMAMADVTIRGVQAVQQELSAPGVPFPQKLLQAAYQAAEAAANVQRINSVGNFAGGGIVPGSSFSGDSQQANVNSGEMILNRMQQANLFSMANGSGGGSQRVVINNYGNKTEVSTQTDDQGQLIISIVERASDAAVSRVNQDLTRGDGPTSRAFNMALARNRR